MGQKGEKSQHICAIKILKLYNEKWGKIRKRKKKEKKERKKEREKDRQPQKK